MNGHNYNMTLLLLTLSCLFGSFTLADPSIFPSFPSKAGPLDSTRPLARHSLSPLPPSSRVRININNNATDEVDVREYGAIGDGVTDCTASFIRAVAAVQGGGVVYVGSGYYLLTGQVKITEGVSLVGTYSSVPSHPMAGQSTVPNMTGTVLLSTANHGMENGTAFITLNRDATIRGLVIWYPKQQKHGQPVPYPWTLDLVSENAAVLDVELLNCWNCIRAVNAGRHYIARVQGQPINIGVFIDETYDIGRVENVHFNPWFSTDLIYMRQQLVYGRAFVIARTDWEYVFDCFGFGYAIGYHFIKSSAGSCNGNFVGIGADMCVNASVKVDSSDPWGILIVNGEFTSFMDKQFGDESADSTQIVVSASNTGSVRIQNSAFWGPSNQIALIQGSGTVAFGDCIFTSWDADNTGRHAINATGDGNLSVRGCDFQQDAAQISLESSLKRTVIVGNMFRGRTRISGAVSSPRMQIGLNAADE